MHAVFRKIANRLLGAKAEYQLYHYLHIDVHRLKMQKIEKRISQYRLNVFLARSLDEIDRYIETNTELKNFIVREGNQTAKNVFLVLNEHRNGLFDAKTGHYLWHRDFISGYTYKQSFYREVRHRNAVLGERADIKMPWELARMQYLFVLALAYRATKNEEYVKKIKAVILDFSHCNRYNIGVNWNVSMEVGIRLANMILACELIQDSPLFDQEFQKKLAVMGYEHFYHIKENLENEQSGNNHYLGNLLGLATAIAAFPFLNDVERHFDYVSRSLAREIHRQILKDGGDFEGSTSYHRLAGEILGFTIIAMQKRGFCLNEQQKSTLYLMARYSANLTMDNGLVPQIGDNDSGRVFQVAPEQTRNHLSFINLAMFLSQKTYYKENVFDGFFCFISNDAKKKRIEHPQLILFPDSNLLRYHKNHIYLLMCGSTPEQFHQFGHAHNDLLSFVLSVGNEEIITDLGSGEYTADPQMRNLLRSVQSHSTISVDGEEQRIHEGAGPFRWMSKAMASIDIQGHGNEKTTILGSCEYTNATNNYIQHSRTITVKNHTITVNDVIHGMKERCYLYLPLFPSVNVSNSKDKIVIQGQCITVYITGSWTLSVKNTLFAKQYKRIVPNQTIVGYSTNPSNNLNIDIIIP